MLKSNVEATPLRSSEPAEPTRRDMLRRAGYAGLAGLVAGPSLAGTQPAPAENAAPGSAPSVGQAGEYEKVPLRQDSITVGAIQSRVRAVDVNNLGPTMKANLDHVIELINVAQGTPKVWGGERRWGMKHDLLCMHEFPIQGFQPWTRKELLRVAFDLPGPESEAIGAEAKKHDCYIAFGCYAKDKDWPNHVINMSVIVGPTGEIVSKQWKARNILGVWGDVALIGTTVYDVLDRYVEMYGWDAVLPVARTDIGNIAMTAVGSEPALYQCLALKGTEIMIRTVTGGSNKESVVETASSNRIYCVGVGNSVSPDNPGFAESAGARDGGGLIVDPRGTVLRETRNHHEEIASARIPIADFRRSHKVKELPMALLLPVYQAYTPGFKPNAFLEYLPTDYGDSARYTRERLGSK